MLTSSLRTIIVELRATVYDFSSNHEEEMQRMLQAVVESAGGVRHIFMQLDSGIMASVITDSVEIHPSAMGLSQLHLHSDDM